MDVKPVETELSMRRRSKEEERSLAAMRAPGSPALVLAISGGAWVEKLQTVPFFSSRLWRLFVGGTKDTMGG